MLFERITYANEGSYSVIFFVGESDKFYIDGSTWATSSTPELEQGVLGNFEEHYSEVTCSSCLGKGSIFYKKTSCTCPVCKGTGRRLRCRACGKVLMERHRCSCSDKLCDQCGGTGVSRWGFECPRCMGTGLGSVECDACSGFGESWGGHICDKCGGLGRIPYGTKKNAK